ncbi:hypothetical protein EVAR_70963_1 [Eumeta japonica]|uniref:Uncharacterized protein n=1 Tax=Eumeta variegata TaxID=151549 RepID=A0A4C1SB14_EUMVA|nr:hypothetical protein EVAR_70963_1 [Eumeta japonica]
MKEIKDKVRLPLQQHHFINADSNITVKQPNAIQQQKNLASPTIAVPQVAQNSITDSALSAPPPTSQFVHWSNPVIGGGPFCNINQRKQQKPNSSNLTIFLFNIQAQAAYAAAAANVPSSQATAANSQQETYSVLRVGNGNFLKIYHCPENAMGHLSGEGSFSPMTHYNQGQTTNFHQVHQQGSLAIQQTVQPPQSHGQLTGTTSSLSCQAFNSYELFLAMHTQLPTAEMAPLLLLGPSPKSSALTTTEGTGVDHVTDMETAKIIPNVPNNNANNSNWTCNPYSCISTCNQGHIDVLNHTGPETLFCILGIQQHQQHRSQLNQHHSLAKKYER